MAQAEGVTREPARTSPAAVQKRLEYCMVDTPSVELRSEEESSLAELLAAIDLLILGMRAEDATQKRHWKSLRRHLPLLAQAARANAPESAASIVSAMTAAVQTAILLYYVQAGDH